MHFGTFLDRDGYFFDTVHFPRVAEQFPFRGRGVYQVKGKVSEEFGSYSIEVAWMEKCNLVPDPRYSDVRTTTRIRSQHHQTRRTIDLKAQKREEERRKEKVHGRDHYGQSQTA
jgi:hypothetical protein